MHSRYHPDYPPAGRSLRTPLSPSPVTGAAGFHYWPKALTEPTRESDRFHPPHRLAPPAGSLELPKKASFPSSSFTIYKQFNHKPTGLSTVRFPIFLPGLQLKIVPIDKIRISAEKHLTFLCAHATVSSILKSCDEDGPVEQIPREPAFGESRKSADGVPITSEPEG